MFNVKNILFYEASFPIVLIVECQRCEQVEVNR